MTVDKCPAAAVCHTADTLHGIDAGGTGPARDIEDVFWPYRDSLFASSASHRARLMHFGIRD